MKFLETTFISFNFRYFQGLKFVSKVAAAIKAGRYGQNPSAHCYTQHSRN